MDPETGKRRIAHAVRGLKFFRPSAALSGRRRIAHAVRGLKSLRTVLNRPKFLSHRSRGAWIEIVGMEAEAGGSASHRSRGAWIEIRMVGSTGKPGYCRIAHAVRGLK